MTENTYRWTYDGLERLVDEVFETNLDDLVNGLESLGLEDAASLPASSRAGRDYHDHYTFDLTGNRLSKSTDEDLDGIADRWVDSTYDANDRLLVERQFINTLQGLPGPMPVSERTDYAYDHTQQIDKSVYRGDPPTVSNRLSSLQFQYDLQGRLEISTSTTYSPTDGTQVLTQQRTTYDYDTTGIRVTALTETDSNGDSVFDTRVKTEWLNDPQNFTGYSQVIRETHTTLGDSTHPDRLDKTITYTFGLDEISQTVSTPQPNGSVSSTTHTFLHDGHGSVRALLAAAQALARISIAPSAPAILQLFTFDAYGNALAFRESTAATTLLYSGEQFDQRVMMQYLRARYYDGASGRFVGLDPYSGNSRDPQSLHKYMYTHSNPIRGVDPSGMMNAISVGVSVSIGAALGVVGNGLHNASRNRPFLENGGYAATAGAGLGLAAVLSPALGVVLAGYGLYSALDNWGEILSDPNTTFEQRAAATGLVLFSLAGSALSTKYARSASTKNAFWYNPKGLNGFSGRQFLEQLVTAWRALGKVFQFHDSLHSSWTTVVGIFLGPGGKLHIKAMSNKGNGELPPGLAELIPEAVPETFDPAGVPDEYVPSTGNPHAETRLYFWGKANNMELLTMGTSKASCPDCQANATRWGVGLMGMLRGLGTVLPEAIFESLSLRNLSSIGGMSASGGDAAQDIGDE